MKEDFMRIVNYSLEFYFKKIAMIALFSIPFIFSFLITLFVPAPSYLAIGGAYIRTGSLPELTLVDIAITVAAYAISMFIIADTIVNINLIIKSKRTMSKPTSEVLGGMGKYATKIFTVMTMMVLLTFIFQLLVYELPFQPLVFSLFLLLVSFALFFVSPAIVIDGSGTAHAIYRSVSLARKKWHFVLAWTILGLFLVSAVKVASDQVLPGFSSYIVLFVNSLFILPFLIVLQTQMYMEKYPLAR